MIASRFILINRRLSVLQHSRKCQSLFSDPRSAHLPEHEKLKTYWEDGAHRLGSKSILAYPKEVRCQTSVQIVRSGSTI